MGDDLYSALIGGGVGTRGDAISAALRRRRLMGELGTLTGDKVLSAVGGDLSKSSDEYAKQLADIESDNRRQTQTKNYQDQQIQYMNDNLKETHRNNTLDYLAAMYGADQRLAGAGLRGGGRYKLTNPDKKDLQNYSETIGTIDGIEDFYANGGSLGAKKVFGVPIPGSRALTNTLANQYGIGSGEDKATALVQQNWDRLYTLAARNNLFGATLTGNELKSWNEANPSVGMTDEQIKTALPIMKKVYQHRLQQRAEGLISEGYNPDAIGNYADIPDMNFPTTVGRGENSQRGANAAPGDKPDPGSGMKPKRFKMNADGTFTPSGN